MIKSYFYLYRFVSENQKLLASATVTEIYTQEKNKLFLAIPTDELPFRHLIIDANQNFTSLLIKDEHRKAKKNFKNFITERLPATINNIQICDKDRVLKFILGSFEIYFSVMGSKSNIYFALPGEIVPFRKLKLENVEGFLQSKNFVFPEIPFKFPKESPRDFVSLKKEFPFLNKFIQNEYVAEIDSLENELDSTALENICNKILTDDISIGLNETDYSIKMFPSSWKTFQDLTELARHKTFNDALISYFSFYYRFTKESKLKKELNALLNQQLDKLSNRLNELKNRIEEGSKENIYRKYADLLAVYRNKIFKGMPEIQVADFETSKEITITLDVKLSAQQNIEKYYSKARNEKISFEKSAELFNESKEKYLRLFELRRRLDDIRDLKELELLKKNLSKGKVKTGEQSRIKFRHFLIDGRYHLFVGRDSQDNDELTFRFAKQNDFWFHARGYAGSHTVLRNDNPKEKIPKNILKAAASVAAFYSKGKTAGLVPVSYTFRKYVRKKKGMEPGKVLLQREDTLIVKPEIPTNCEQIFE